MPVPKLRRYSDRDSLRPNPETANPEAAFPFGQETIRVGHFGSSWAASARVTNGLPPETAPKPGGLGLLPECEESVRTAKTLRRPVATGA